MPSSGSAVAEFWKTFSPLCEAAPRVPRRRKSNNLPAELLLIIFRLVYEQEIDKPWKHKYWRHDVGDLLSPSFFPYAIAGVCSLWRDVMALVPEFWVDVVILVDSTPAPPISVIRSHLSLSADLPLQITISRTNFDRHVVDVQEEGTRVLSIMNIVTNHCMHRLQGLRFHVVFSSSLPPFPDGFPTNSLSHLQLHCDEDNGRSVDFWESVTSTAPEQHYSSLRALCIDGRNYYNTCRTAFWQTAQFKVLNVVTIANYAPLSGESFTPSNFVFPITTLNIESLRIHNVALVPPPPTGTLSIAQLRRPIYELQLRDIHNFETIAGIIWGLGDQNIDLVFTRCAIGDFRIPVGGIWNELTLVDINADQNLIPLLRCWRGNILRISNCPSFDDAVLDMMASSNMENTCAARSTDVLLINDCDKFSGTFLRRLVHARLGGFDRGVGFAIDVIKISGRAPKISSEDQEWLSQNLSSFDYTPYESPPASSSSLPSPI